MAGTKHKSKGVKESGSSLKKKRDVAGVSNCSSTPSTANNGSPSSVTRREPPTFVVPSPSQISPPPPRKPSSSVQKQNQTTSSRSPGSQSSGLRPQHQLQRVLTPLREPEPDDQLNIVEQDGEDEDEVDEEEGDEEEGDEEEVDEDAMDHQQPPGHQGMPLEALLNMDGRALLQRLSPIEGQGTW